MSIKQPDPNKWRALPVALWCVVFGLTGPLLLGCATESQQTKTEGTLAGAGIGAAIGAAAGGNRDAAVAGALLGGLLGHFFGQSVADKKAAYAQSEKSLNESAGRAQALAERLRAHNQTLDRDISRLQASVQRLQSDRLTAENRRNANQVNERTLAQLNEQVTAQLRQVRQEIAQQQQVVLAEEKRAKEIQQRPPDQGIRLVSIGIRELQGHEQALERARLQLQQIDPRRAYQ